MNVQNPIKIKLLNTPYYPLDTYFDFHPGASLEDYVTYIESIQISERLKRANRNPFLKDLYSGIRRVVINDTYSNWLEGNQSKHSALKVQEYMNLLTDEEVEQLWREHELNGGYTVEYLPVSLESDSIVNEGTISLPQQAINFVYQYASQARNSEQVLVFPQMVEAPFLDSHFEQYLLDKAHDIFQHHRDIELLSIDGFHGYRHLDVEIRFVPLVTYKLHSPIVTLDEESNDQNSDALFEATSELSARLQETLPEYSQLFVIPELVTDPNEFEMDVLTAR